MIQIFDDKKQRIAVIENVSDLCIESTLEYGDKKISFKYPKNGSHVDDLKNEYYVRTKTDEYVLKSIADGTDTNEYIAQLNIEELESKQYTSGFESVERTIKLCLTEAFKETPWKVGTCQVSKKRTIRKDTQCSAWEIVKDCVSTYRVEIKINSLEKVIDIYEQVGSDKGSYIIEGLNLKKLSRKKTTYDFFNVIIPLGKENIGIDVLGKNYIENFQYTTKRIVRIWKDERYTNTTSLYEDAKAKLDESSKPVEAYSAEVADLAAQNEQYSVLDYGVGDVVELISKSSRIKTKQRVVKLKEYPKEPSKNTAELSTAKKTFAEIQKQAQEVSKQEAIDASKNAVKAELGEDYYTKTETETRIAANNEEIILEAKEIFTEKSELTGYYTKEETTSAINVAAKDIELSASKKYQTSNQVKSAIDGSLEDYSTTTEMKGEITASAEKISLSVSQKVGYDEIIASINLSKERIKIDAEKIELTGVVTISDLQGSGKTEINADNLTSGTIRGLRFEAGEIDIETDARLGRILYLGSGLDGKKGIEFSENSAIYFSNSNLINVSSAFLVYPVDPLGQGNIPHLRFISDAADDYFYNGLSELEFTFGGASSDFYMGRLQGSMDGNLSIMCKSFVSNKGLSVSSDVAYKMNFEDVSVDWIEDIEIVKYDLIDGSSDNDIGIRANDYEDKEYAKYFLSRDMKGRLAVDYKNIANALIKYVQQLEKRVKKLEESRGETE